MNRKLSFLFAFLVNFLPLGIINAQTLFKDNSAEEPVRLDPHVQQVEFVPGQILIKFKDEVVITPTKQQGLAKTGVATIDAVLSKYAVKDIDKLFKNATPLKTKKILKSFSGETFEQPSLHNIYKLEVTEPVKMFEVIEALKNDPNVEYAEPNYIFSIVEAKPASDILSENELKLLHNSESYSSPTTLTPSDPLYPQQYWIPATQVDAVWDSTTGDTTQVIAILDTGVDWLHPDLADNIWINYAELNGITGIDDDGNGFVDDIRGWDFINNDNDPRDDNSHGTHVAGIAAARGNNGIGIAGVNWYAKIMPIKVFQSSGRGDVARITQGIWYAINKGANVLNMSWGSYARSMIMESVLQYAYATTILVAAAGNDGLPMAPCIPAAPFYPASLSYVFGVEASEPGGGLTGFSNLDCDGPVFSVYDELLNYELRAPGFAIISCIPNGNYRAYSGTSMATAIVSAAVLLYRKLIPDETWEMMWIKLINSRGSSLGDVKFFDALIIQPKPLIYQLSRTIVDSCATCDKDGRVDAGETIEVWFKVRNVGGPCDSVFYKIRFTEFEDTTTAQILKSTAFVGSMGPYATRNSSDPFIIKINPNVAHDRDIVFEGLMWYKGAPDTTIQRIVLTIEHGEELKGVLDTTLILYPNKLYLVNNSFKVGDNGILIIKPGTKLFIYPGYSIPIKGKLIADGKLDSLICITGFPFAGNVFIFRNSPSINNRISYCKFENLSWPIKADGGNPADVYNSIFINVNMIGIVDTFINNQYYSSSEAIYSASYIERSNFIAPSNSRYPGYALYGQFNIKHNNFINFVMPPNWYENRNSQFANSWITRNDISYKYQTYYMNLNDFQYIQYQYWGTGDSSRIEKFIYDFMDNPTLPRAVFHPFLTAPPESCHGIVWKVLVNGIDAQDERHLLEPVGPGPVRFDVYFNRPMDTTYTPQLSFGVREPYNQHFVTDSARWSPDGRVWTAYYTVKLHTGDGINRIRVAGARDPEGFEIPVEDMRFEFIINAAGAASAGFTATPGLGKITLEWERPDLPDILGYNMYRFTNITDTTYTEPALINSSLITDTFYVDYDVVPGKRYYYQYRVVRTNLTETDPSRIISAIPLTSAMGDANGDFSVNVLDIITIVNYILGQNPQPFIFEASDINRDSVINVLDIIGVVNIILGSNRNIVSTSGTTTQGSASIELIKNRLELKTDVPIAGIQFKLQGSGVSNPQFTLHSDVEGFEVANGIQGDTSRIYLIFNINGKTLPPGHYILGTFQNINQNIHLVGAILSDPRGNSVATKVINDGEPLIPTEYYLRQNYPNPFNSSTIIQFGLPERAEVKIVIYNILGQKVRTFNLGVMDAGRHQIIWDGRNEAGNIVASGVYFYQMRTAKFTQAKKLLFLK